MQEIGKGPASTRYGNNVTMPAGRYNVTVMIKGKRLAFVVALTDAPAGHMKCSKGSVVVARIHKFGVCLP
jgi:hypothetical protein